MHTDGLQGYSSRCLVKAEENSFEYKQLALLETIVILFHCFPKRNTASKPYKRWFVLALSLVLLLSIVLPAALWRLKVWQSQTGHAANDKVRFQTLALLLSIVWGSSADNPIVDIQWTQRGVQNDDQKWPVQLISKAFSSIARAKMPANIYKCFECNTSLVVDNINFSEGI